MGFFRGVLRFVNYSCGPGTVVTDIPLRNPSKLMVVAELDFNRTTFEKSGCPVFFPDINIRVYVSPGMSHNIRCLKKI